MILEPTFASLDVCGFYYACRFCGVHSMTHVPAVDVRSGMPLESIVDLNRVWTLGPTIPGDHDTGQRRNAKPSLQATRFLTLP
jgi:hypothetical protein